MPNPIKVALITGAARRIGAEIAKTLHHAGMNIVLHCHHSLEEASALCADLNKKRAQSAHVLQADLLDSAECRKLAFEANAVWGRLDVLVNNASRFYKTPVGDVLENQWADLMDCNVKAPFFLCQTSADYLQEHRGCIINITDIHGENPLRDYSVYCISKAALLMMTKVLAKELAPTIRVNAISPGAMIWPEGENQLSEAAKKKIINDIALQRHGNANDIARAVLFFLVDADYVTGQVLAVDGGRMLSM